MRDFFTVFPLIQEVPPWFLEDRVLDGVKMPAHAWQLSLYGLYTAVPPTESGTISVPTLILWGAQDGMLPRPDQNMLATRIERAELKIYPDAAHLVLWELPERVAADASAFLSSLD